MWVWLGWHSWLCCQDLVLSTVHILTCPTFSGNCSLVKYFVCLWGYYSAFLIELIEFFSLKLPFSHPDDVTDGFCFPCSKCSLATAVLHARTVFITEASLCTSFCLCFIRMCIFPLKWDSRPNCWVSSLCRNVTDADILALERRLLQTMDMIISKKKRWERSSCIKWIMSRICSRYGIRWSWNYPDFPFKARCSSGAGGWVGLELCGVSFWPDMQLRLLSGPLP